ncbi:hypothetical protein [Nakamurella multipartita]|uniref:Uncharacterized protein n=1 Tax=Nakamurella multipartita (strain ATCC 700099 / DSM 44233 / CIP 104796 / JCM 9543 / NBRC 105858 / Y-104) TaxID=479431 RepID=C8X8L6_NAKMY|nr:hypothetical protein [Nakamurella multipartita]ACV79071.1 hypothetical protein Namu_2725 [Nakamurella multipartita DSM 44233]
MGTSAKPPGALREYITYADFAWATNRFGPGEDIYLLGMSSTARYRVVGALSDNEFLARGERTGALVLARLEHSRLQSEVLVVFAGLVDNGRDAQDVMLDVDRANTWFGWVTDPQVRAMRRRIRLRLLRNPA